MKKTILTIIMIIILVMGLLLLTGCEKEQGLLTATTDNTVNNTSATDNKYKGYTNKEWENKIKEFYEEYKNVDVSRIICQYDSEKNYTATVTFQKGETEKFVFDDNTGYAKEQTTKVTIDFINKKIVNQIKDLSNLFTDSICLAIGYTTHYTEDKFIKKYFDTYEVYRSIPVYDFRDSLSRQSQYEDKFFIIPKNDEVKISIYDCHIDNNGNVVKDSKLIGNESEPFVLIYENAESTMPQYVLELNVGGFQDEFPLTFSGEDGTLVLTEHETEVRDISIYD